MKPTTTNIIFTSALSLFSIQSFAQKKPQIQEVSVRAPENIKIDGKLTEWPDKYLNAYNSTARIYYVISNDDNNLYLTARGMGNGVAKKMVAGGFILTISHVTERKARQKDAGNVTLTFPTPQDAKTVSSIMSVVNQVADYTDDTVRNRKQIDSIVFLANKAAGGGLKEIGVTGIKEAPDSVISVYNAIGVKAALQFIKMQPIVEIAIPLKYLGLSTENAVKFSYNIKLKAVPEILPGAYPAPMVVASPGGPPPPMPIPNANALFAVSDQDFWGEYTLVKK